MRRRLQRRLELGLDSTPLLDALRIALANLPKPRLWRPDLGTLRGAAMVVEIDKMEAEGLLVRRGGVLEYGRAAGEIVAQLDTIIQEIGVQWEPWRYGELRKRLPPRQAPEMWS